ncbi:filamentous hemagglutinin N-terminal domain-containing protein [Providencia burhodogranariea]|uniref:Hemagglutinin n=1 Tax=Providencia burhodogranariea DSM 19968 TaxID=1141662 RepID=K8X0K4_9GAMM|nr:filamentous hemagglutinin N-terminal domain-containing protein [Providencia burhodogranariea]EKT61990.1 hemagglutinin [Providencia burhodogranariea DSM 19968]
MNRKNKSYFKLVFLFFSFIATLSMATIMQANSINELESDEQIKNLEKANVQIFNIASTINDGSLNTVDSFDVTESGTILNNSKDGADTQLSGHIDGNSNLSNGVAKVIVLEVNSKNPSTVNGLVEVAGSNAQVILSNPSGIICNSCGFLSANRVVLTTGSLSVKNNTVDGYKVEKGNIAINNGATFNSVIKNIDLIARNIFIDGIIDVNSSEVRITTGANQVNAENDQAIAITGSGATSKYSFQIVKDAELNTKSLKFIGTENKSPLQIYGKLGAEEGGINIVHSGILQNEKGKISTKGDVNISLDGGISNITGKIKSSKTITIDTKGQKFSNIDGSDISSLGTVSINSGALTNYASYIASDNLLNIQTNGNEITNSSTIGANLGLASTNGITINSGLFSNKKGKIESNGNIDFNTNNKNFNNIDSTIDTAENINLNSGIFNNNQSRLRSIKKVTINTNGNTLKNDGLTADTDSDDSLGILSGEGGMSITISGLTNDKAIIATEGNMDFVNKGKISNQWGHIKSGGFLNFTSESIDNLYGGLAAKQGADVTIEKTLDNNFGVVFLEGENSTIKTPYVNNHKGVIKGDSINIKTNKFNNTSGLIVTQVDLDIDSAEVTNNNSSGYRPEMGFYIGQPDQIGGVISKGNIILKGDKLTSSSGRIITEKGNLDINYKTVDNSRGLIASKKEAFITSETFTNNHGTLYGKEKLKLNTNKLSNTGSGTVEDNNLDGVIASDGMTEITISTDFENKGMISGIKELLINVNGKYTNGSKSFMSGENGFNLRVTGNVINNGTLNSTKISSITGKDITNEKSGVIVGRDGVKIDSSGSYTNKGKVVGQIIE